MFRTLCLATCFVGMLTTTAFGDDENATKDLVRVPDANLRAALYKERKKEAPDGEMVPREILTGVYFLNARKQDIADLTGIEHCTNLGEARFTDNKITDVTPLAECRSLQSLDLAHNSIKDVSALGALAKLQYLQIEHNEVASLNGLESLEALTCLYAAHNQIADIRPVASLQKLWTLDLNHNRIEDISPVSELTRLFSLGLAHNRITDVSEIPPGNSTYATYLQGNEITDISPLVELAKKDADGDKRFVSFWRLYLADNPLNEESESQHLPRLKDLGVRLNLEYAR